MDKHSSIEPERRGESPRRRGSKMNIAAIHGRVCRQHQSSGWRHSLLVTLADGTRTHVSAAKRSELRRRLLRRGLTVEQIAEAFAGESEASE